MAGEVVDPTRSLRSVAVGLTSIEICAGAGGQALGLEQAGFVHTVLVEIDPWACETLRTNRPNWNVIEGDVRSFSAKGYDVDLLAGGVPCPPFSKAGKQLGSRDERDLFPEALRLVAECRPRVVLLENVRGLLDRAFDGYRRRVTSELRRLGYAVTWSLLNASDFGVPQLRPRTLLVALLKSPESFSWPIPETRAPPTVGEILYPLMASNGWRGAEKWAAQANKIAPTLVGGSRKHGGPDLGPTRARHAWARLDVDGRGIADEPPLPDFGGTPRLTVEMVALLQGFPPDWEIAGRKTAAYRQLGNAFPPPVARALGEQIGLALQAGAEEAAA
jgi:DNA (cytosine-5)-methyltransferase 1